MYRTAQHAKTSRVDFRRKIGAGLVTGCLAASMLPAVAFAAPMQDAAPDQAMGQQPAHLSQGWQDSPDGSDRSGGEQGGFEEAVRNGEEGAAPQDARDAQSPAKGQAPADDQAPAGDRAPAGGKAPAGEQGLDGQAPTGDRAPGDGKAPAGDGAFADGQAPAGGEAPADDEAPAGGKAASGEKASTEGRAPADDDAATDVKAPAGDRERAGDAMSEGDQRLPEGSEREGAPQQGAPRFGQPGQPNAADDAELDARIIAAIPDDDVRARAEAGNPDRENARPSIPEGEVNVQQIIDTIRQALMETDGQDAPAADQAPEQAFDRVQGQAPDQAQAPAGEAQAAPANDDTSGLALFQKIVETIKAALGL